MWGRPFGFGDLAEVLRHNEVVREGQRCGSLQRYTLGSLSRIRSLVARIPGWCGESRIGRDGVCGWEDQMRTVISTSVIEDLL